jgi:hypothetical protein
MRNTLALIIGQREREIVGNFFIESWKNDCAERIRKMVKEVLSELAKKEELIINITTLTNLPAKA